MEPIQKGTKSGQLFNRDFPHDLIFSLLREISTEEKGTYCIDKFVYRKGMYDGKIQAFIEGLRSEGLYRKCKESYVEREITYNSFLTVIRQMCNYHGIKFYKKIVYDRSLYETKYYVEGRY